MALATAPAIVGTPATELRPGAWMRQWASDRDIVDNPDRDVIWHRYSGRLDLNDVPGDARAHCGQLVSLPHDVRTDPPLLLRIETSEVIPANACRNCLRGAA